MSHPSPVDREAEREPTIPNDTIPNNDLKDADELHEAGPPVSRSPSPDDSKVVLADSRYFEVYTVPSENNNVIIRIRSHPDCTDAVPPHGYPTPA